MKKILCLILVCYAASICFGVPVLQENFETGIDGQSFPDWNWPSEQVITDNGIDGKSLKIYRSNPSLGNWGIVSDRFTPTFGLIEFDLLIDTPCVLYTKTDQDHGGQNPELVVFSANGNIGCQTPTETISTTATWTAGQAFTLGVLSLADEFFVYINDIEIANVQRISLYSDLPIESFFFSYGADNIVSPGTIMIDNVFVIPEPATLMLLGLGGLLIRRKK